MVVKVEQIAEEGLQLNESIGLELLTRMLSEDGDTGFRPIRPSRLNATLRKMRDGVLVRGQFTVHLTGPCKRCLVDVVTEIPVPFTLNLMNRASREQDEESGSIRFCVSNCSSLCPCTWFVARNARACVRYAGRI